ncbi:RloB domain-containing protein [Spirulina sp. CS-785/01]|uniref:RloB domain-containing protein n=1 Tax=Spirulina sp. CS-785/01 TaxID=3021716 RepID=UPI002331311D|nr:RloB domain-containing protein [Spirulina sp. CS-785/01]MDB9315809.1 RloB domain-containing protein [Spirulina sp. CS-785/01]
MAKRKSRPKRKSKKIYYFIVEGCTEENYINHLKKLYKTDAKIKNCNGGSAANVLKNAKKEIQKGNDDYVGYIIWFDQDRFEPRKDTNLKQSLEAKPIVQLYISSPCIENWILAHFTTIDLDEPTCKTCENKLKKYIPEYDKNDCYILDKYITLEGIEQAINNYYALSGIPKLFH